MKSSYLKVVAKQEYMTRKEDWSHQVTKTFAIAWMTLVLAVIFHAQNADLTNVDMNADKTENGYLIVLNLMEYPDQ